MRDITLDIDEKYFNLIWRSLKAREEELEAMLDNEPVAANDLVYLRLCQKELEEKAKEAKFSDNVFSTDDGYMDLSDI